MFTFEEEMSRFCKNPASFPNHDIRNLEPATGIKPLTSDKPRHVAIRRVYWYDQVSTQPAPAASGRIDADVVIVGGGIAGLTAALRLRTMGKDVVLLEATECGAGATGRSSGFITPDSELGLGQLVIRFGASDATLLWRAAQHACERIRSEINQLQIECDFVPADSLLAANTTGKIAAIRKEHEAHERLGFRSDWYDREHITEILGGEGFTAGVRTFGTFAINAFAYAQGLKRAFIAAGGRCFEGSPVTEILSNAVRTNDAVAQSQTIVLSLDRYAPVLGIETKDTYHAQAFLTVTEPLTDDMWQHIFPEAPLLVCDSDLIYQYFRRTGEGRLLVGGGLLSETYAAKENPNPRAFRKIERYARQRFPGLKDARFTHAWQGFIGMSKDLLPIAGRSPTEPGHYVAMCGAGLPWSVLAGECVAAQVIGDSTPIDHFFVPKRTFNRVEAFQPILGKPLTWALSYYFAKQWP
ncbi:MAG: FAD-binding oxidoreductase [Planctomycetes bacterium]|nr:FAD-binding oxidoreductase [Planctomycetota bacterium]